MRLLLSMFAVSVLQLMAFAQTPRQLAGAVYTATNSPSGNAVLVFNKDADGNFAPPIAFPTGGAGTGSGLSNQGGVVLSENHQWLLAVNAGSNTVSVFEVLDEGLSLTDVQESGGARPVSIAIHDEVVYVLNAGDAAIPDNISGFRLTNRGQLKPVAYSTLLLSGRSVGPAQIAFNSTGDALMVTERLTGRIDIFSVDRDGFAFGLTVYNSSGLTPFGFAFGKREQVFVSEAFGGAANSSAASSYALKPNGRLRLVSGSVRTTETSACWLVVSSDGRFAYTANAASATISAYRIDFGGRLQLIHDDGVAAALAGGGPTDMALSADGRFLYVLQSGGGRVSSFAVGADGSLDAGTALPAIAPGANGLAVR